MSQSAAAAAAVEGCDAFDGPALSKRATRVGAVTSARLEEICGSSFLVQAFGWEKKKEESSLKPFELCR